MSEQSDDPDGIGALARQIREASAALNAQASPANRRAYRQAVTRARRLPEISLLFGVVVEPETQRRVAEVASRAADADAATTLWLAGALEQAADEIRAFRASSPLPDAATRAALVTRHLAYLDALDARYGPPSAEDVAAAERRLDELLKD